MSEKYSIRGRSCSGKLIIVMDTSALLAKYHLQIPGYIGEITTTNRVVEEVRDMENREALELGIDINRVRIVEPRKMFLERVLEKAREIGEHVSLSRTDLDVAALAYMYREEGCRVVVFTDDYSLQNLLAHLKIPFKPLRTRGIRIAREYRVYCPVCGYVSFDPGEEVCPICGSRLAKKTISRRRL